MLAVDQKLATFSWVFGRRMHKQRRSTWKIRSWTMPKSWVRGTWNASSKTRGQRSSPCLPLRPGSLLQSCILSTQTSNITASSTGWWKMVWNFALRMMRQQWCLWMLLKMCSSPTITDSWCLDIFLLHQQLPEHLCVFSHLVFLYKTIMQRQAALQLPAADSVMCSNWCWVTGQGWWQRCCRICRGLGSGASSSKILWLTVRFMQKGLPLCVNMVMASGGSGGDLWVSVVLLTDFCTVGSAV